MVIPREGPRTLALLGALLALAFTCTCKGRSGSEHEHAAPETTAGASTVPALWEPIDKNFTGCEGG